MAYKRKRTTSRAPSRNYPRKRRRTNMRVARSRFNTNVHHFKRTVQMPGLITSYEPNTLQDSVRGAIEFKLSNLSNVDEFTNLFDQYRINAINIKVEFIPSLSGFDGHPMTTTPVPYVGLPHLHTVIDYDDANAPASKNALMEYSNYKRTRGDIVQKRYFRPAVSTRSIVRG